MVDVELTGKQRAQIKRAVKALNDVRAELDNEYQGNNISWYLDGCGSLNLMKNSSHDLSHESNPGLHENIIAYFTLDNSTGGDW